MCKRVTVTSDRYGIGPSTYSMPPFDQLYAGLVELLLFHKRIESKTIRLMWFRVHSLI